MRGCGPALLDVARFFGALESGNAQKQYTHTVICPRSRTNCTMIKQHRAEMQYKYRSGSFMLLRYCKGYVKVGRP